MQENKDAGFWWFIISVIMLTSLMFANLKPGPEYNRYDRFERIFTFEPRTKVWDDLAIKTGQELTVLEVEHVFYDHSANELAYRMNNEAVARVIKNVDDLMHRMGLDDALNRFMHNDVKIQLVFEDTSHVYPVKTWKARVLNPPLLDEAYGRRYKTETELAVLGPYSGFVEAMQKMVANDIVSGGLEKLVQTGFDDEVLHSVSENVVAQASIGMKEEFSPRASKELEAELKQALDQVKFDLTESEERAELYREVAKQTIGALKDNVDLMNKNLEKVEQDVSRLAREDTDELLFSQNVRALNMVVAVLSAVLFLMLVFILKHVKLKKSGKRLLGKQVL